MRLTKLHLVNFRVHADTVMDCGNSSYVVVRGKNFAGKSSIGQALSMCLTPSTTGLDAQGRGFTSKIKRGASKAVITADIQTKRYLVRRVVTLNAGSAGRIQQSACVNDPDWSPIPFDRKLETSKAALTVALNTDAFLRMDEKDQKNLLAGLALPDHYDFDKDIVAEVDEVLGEGAVNFDGEPFYAIQQAYKFLFQERQVINRQVRDFMIPDPIPMPAGANSQELQDQLTALRVSRREKQQERDRAVAEAGRAEIGRTQAKAKAQTVQYQIDDEEHRKQSIEAFLLPDESMVALQKVVLRRGELDEALAEKQQIEEVIDDYLRRLGRLDDMPEAGKDCPTCGQFIDPQKLEQAVAGLTAELHEAKNRNQTAHQKIMALRDVQEAVEAIERHDGALRELAAIANRVEEKRAVLAAQMAAVPEAVLFDFQPYDRSIAEYDAEIEKLSAELRPLIVAEERRKEVAVRVEQLTALKVKAASLDRLVKYFGKDGIKAKLIGEYIGGFEAKLNEVLGAWNYSCAVSIDPYTFDVTNARGDVIPTRELSGAERIMFSSALQCAVSWTANIGLVVIDEIATLLPELRPTLNRRLHEMIRQHYLEQVILLVSDVSEQIPDLEDAAIFMVENGEVRKLCHDGRRTTMSVRSVEEVRRSYPNAV